MRVWSALAVAALFLGVTSGESETNRRVKRFATQSCSSREVRRNSTDTVLKYYIVGSSKPH